VLEFTARHVLTLVATFTLVIEMALICLGSNYIAATIPFTFFTVYWIQKFYLRTSRQIRFLDLESKSPLYQQFTETIEGVATIRGFGTQQAFRDEFLIRLDESQKAYYIMLTIQRWLLLVLDGTVGGMTVVLVAFALLVPSSSSAGGLGVALTSVLSFNQSLQQLIMAWTQVETSLGSVARTKSFEETTPNENGGESGNLPDKSWPSGRMEVKGLKVRYGEETVALTNLNLDIEPGQKLGICGRSGR
jgi:ATP-binding cassette subfamily C (CFTR/MRP) protein 1